MNNDTMQQLKKKLDIIKNVIPKGSCIYYFDYPVYNNGGDMLIWKGTEKFFKEANVHVKKRFSCHHVIRKLEEGKKIDIPKDIIIVCQGGGNFGDLYASHQKMRKLLIEMYPLHRIVIMPQTIYYQDVGLMDDEFIDLSKHKDLHVFVRDKSSYNLAKDFFRNLYLSPDMAHALFPIKAKDMGESNILYFIRLDKEKTEIKLGSPENVPISLDWNLLLNKGERWIMDIFQLLHNSSKVNWISPPGLLPKLWGFYAGYLVRKAVHLFGNHRVIISSRLHGHILACLMEIDNQLIDNSYGKNLSYYSCWTNGVKNASVLGGAIK